jgi:PTS system nitrogen regulatory IIA component
MTISALLTPDRVLIFNPPPDKPQLLSDLAARIASVAQLDPSDITNALLKREGLGSTGLGAGIAIPHARVPGIQGPIGLLAILHSPIEFDAIDGRPVDIVFMLVMPDDKDALKALAGISRLLRQPELLAALRRPPSAAIAYQAMLGAERE